MKKTFVLFFLAVLYWKSSNAQTNTGIPFNEINNFIENGYAIWLKSLNSINIPDSLAKIKRQELYHQAVGKFANPLFNNENKNAQYTYDKQSETFQIKFKSFPEIYLIVPYNESMNFTEQIPSITFYNIKFLIENQAYKISSAQVMVPDKNKKYTYFRYAYDAKKNYQFNLQHTNIQTIPPIIADSNGIKDLHDSTQKTVTSNKISSLTGAITTNPSNQVSKIQILEELLQKAIKEQNYLLANEIKNQIQICRNNPTTNKNNQNDSLNPVNHPEKILNTQFIDTTHSNNNKITITNTSVNSNNLNSPIVALVKSGGYDNGGGSIKNIGELLNGQATFAIYTTAQGKIIEPSNEISYMIYKKIKRDKNKKIKSPKVKIEKTKKATKKVKKEKKKRTKIKYKKAKTKNSKPQYAFVDLNKCFYKINTKSVIYNGLCLAAAVPSFGTSLLSIESIVRKDYALIRKIKKSEKKGVYQTTNKRIMLQTNIIVKNSIINDSVVVYEKLPSALIMNNYKIKTKKGSRRIKEIKFEIKKINNENFYQLTIHPKNGAFRKSSKVRLFMKVTIDPNKALYEML